MIEQYLIDSGLSCGTIKNFSTEILRNMKLANSERWYFKTPIKVSGSKLKTATIDMAFPFIVKQSDIDERAAIIRINEVRECFEKDLLRFLRRKFIVPPDTAIFSVIPFWAAEKGERNERKDFAGLRIHIINAVVTVKYRDSWFN